MLTRLLLALLLPAGLVSGAAVEYNRDIRPILSENCFRCHGPDQAARKGKLRLDLREDAIAARKNGAALLPGKPDESGVIKRLTATDPDDVMPPPDTHKEVSFAQREVIRRWIAEGANYQPHWAYITPVRPALPEVENAKPKVQNPIDAFVVTKLREKQTELSPEADRRTLLRRLCLDLTGLPPTPEEVEAFVQDRSSKAYERQVRRLLKSPHYGERMAVSWLDVARYADTVGYHGDQNINVFPYRDYVINAFNANKPYDQFTIEQLAGDLLPNPTTEQRVATAFNRLNMVTREGGAQPKEYLAKYGSDRVRTVSTTWLGSTMGCCECHDHKFDPFSARDFYSMKAFFADIRQWGVYANYDYTPEPDLAGIGNDHPFPPEIIVDSPYLEQRVEHLRSTMRQVATASLRQAWTNTTQRASILQWVAQTDARLQQKDWDGWNPASATSVSGFTNATINADGELIVTGERKDAETEVKVSLPAGRMAALRMELLPEGTNGIVRGSGFANIRLTARLATGTNAPRALTFSHAEATHKLPRFANGYEELGIIDSWRTDTNHLHEPQAGIWALTEPLVIQPGDTLLVTVKSEAIRRARFAVTPFAGAKVQASGASPGLRAAFKAFASKAGTEARLNRALRTTDSPELATLAEAWLLGASADTDSRRTWFQTQREWLLCRDGKSPVVITEAWAPRPTRVLARGNFQDESGEIVWPNPPHFLPRGGLPTDRTLNRLDLARWLVAPENPLTARVFVNRLWKQFFGTGLSAVVDDLGAQGESPSHPELLDWLAVEFRESGWDVKHMAELIVTSHTYRQSANLRPELHDLDPGNRLLASQNPRRLEAEFVRDNALAIAGLLEPSLGGPSAFPYQPPGYYANLQFPNRDYYPSGDERQYRRGLYAHWQRTFLQPMLANFDAPAREECTASRNVSNTPQQALTLLNDRTFVEASRVFAQRLLASKQQTDEQRINQAFVRALARPAKASELSSLRSFLAEQRTAFRSPQNDAAKFLRTGLAPTAAGTDPVELAAWTQVARVVLNLHETITRY
jgi:hypothetical protein